MVILQGECSSTADDVIIEGESSKCSALSVSQLLCACWNRIHRSLVYCEGHIGLSPQGQKFCVPAFSNRPTQGFKASCGHVAPVFWLARLNEHPRDHRITFYEHIHAYYLDGCVKFPLSVTGLWRRFFEEFDSRYVVDTYFERWVWNDTSKYHQGIWDSFAQGYSPEQIKDNIIYVWQRAGEEASMKGTRLHRQIEWFLNGLPFGELTGEFSQFLSYLRNVVEPAGWVPYRTEWSVFDDVHMVAGQIDCVFRDAQGKFHMVDWKCSRKDLSPLAGMGWCQYGYEPCDCLLDNAFSHYALQQNLYAVILKDFYGILIETMSLVQLHDSREQFIVIPVPCYAGLARSLLYLASFSEVVA